MGQQKLRAQRLDSLISDREEDQEWQNQRTPSYAEGFYTQREADQLIADVSASTQSQYSAITGGILEILTDSQEGDRSLSSVEFTQSAINSTASCSGSSPNDSADSADLAWRTLPLAPPQVGGFNNDSVPSLVDGDTPEGSSDIQSDRDIDEVEDSDQIFIGDADAVLSLTVEANNIHQIVHGTVQGMAISPWEYGLSLQQLYLAEQEASSQQENEGSQQANL